MKEKCDIKQSCSFYVSNMHFVTMIMPFIKNKIENEATITTFLENNYTNDIELILSRLKIKEEEKNKILNINWKETQTNKYINIEKTIKNNIIQNKENIIIINGRNAYNEMMDECLKRFFKNNSKQYENTKIWVMDFYEAEQFNENITKILDSHEIIFNTSGEHKIEEIFDKHSMKMKIN